MAELEIAPDQEAPVARRGRPDLLTLLVGLLSLGMAVAAFIGQAPDLSGIDLRWVLAVAAAVAGVLLLMSGLRGRRKGNPNLT